MLIRDTRPGTFTREDVKEMLAGWRRRGSAAESTGTALPFATAGLCRTRSRHPDADDHRLGRERCGVGRELTHGTDGYVTNLRIEHLPGISWVQQEAPEK